MKKLILLTMVLTALLCGCGKEAPAETTVPTEVTTVPTTEPTTVPTTEPAPVYTNPLTGEVVEEPFDRRIFGFTIGNTRESFPHYGVSKSDLLYESFVNGLTTRRFAMYSDVRNVESVGGVRSMRIQWTDLCQGYDAIAIHAAGSGHVLQDMHAAGIDNFYAEQWDADFHYRDKDRMRKGISMEHCLFVRGKDIVAHAESQGVRVTQDPEKDYGMVFSETPASESGETADRITITFMMSNRKKFTKMTYYPQSQAYGMSQYEDIPMVDGYYGEQPELYKNVFALFMPYHGEIGIYHVAETVGEGEGYFGCNGKIIPIRWSRASDNEPFRFTLTDGTPLEQGIGNSYIALLPVDVSTVEWEDLEDSELPVAPVPEEVPAETAAAEAAAPAETAAPTVEATLPSEETFDPADVEVDD